MFFLLAPGCHIGKGMPMAPAVRYVIQPDPRSPSEVDPALSVATPVPGGGVSAQYNSPAPGEADPEVAWLRRRVEELQSALAGGSSCAPQSPATAAPPEPARPAGHAPSLVP